MNPFNLRELGELTQSKADESMTADEVCSICCDGFEKKQKIR